MSKLSDTVGQLLEVELSELSEQLSGTVVHIIAIIAIARTCSPCPFA